MLMQCPKCKKAFPSEKSFCPYDGSALANASQTDFVSFQIDSKYQIDEKIGEGTTGTIYKATHLQLQAPVAVKLMRRDLVNNPTAVERFRREAYAAMKIRHPNAIAVMDFGITSDELVYVVMEFLVGCSLSERLKEKGRFSVIEANNVIQQICAVLNVAHKRGIVHRDLKPDNIFIHKEDGQEIVKVVDFGIAKLIQVLDGMSASDLTGMGSVIGTPHYISPEQCTARAVDPRSDIYSVGIILYRILTGKLPFEGPNSIAVIYKQVTEMPQPINEICPDIPPLINAVVMHALEKDPDRRPKDITTFARELSAVVQTITDQDFRNAFSSATDQDLEAAVLLSLDPSGYSLDYSAGRNRPEPRSKVNNPSSETEPLSVVTLPQSETPKSNIVSSSEFIAVDQEFLHGYFPECDLASVIHTLIGLQVTGSLLVYTNKGAAHEIAKNKTTDLPPPPFCSLYFEQGNVVSTKLGVRVGKEAFFQLFQMPVEGSYIFRPALYLDELRNLEPIIESGEDLWNEAISLKNELQEYKEIFPDLLAGFEIYSNRLNWQDKTNLTLAETIWYLVQQSEMNLAQLLARSPSCNAKTYRIVNLLESTGQISLNDESGSY
ncbi:MAG: protein kinase [Blastocatellia bacterium]|nr:protein kinase [Blastocatellia bacterium]MBL8193728.1 protein kinase [Blastocatellia bacterium]MBN8722173.1 protein kinase [Acidobacteriota bacterium]